MLGSLSGPQYDSTDRSPSGVSTDSGSRTV